MHVNENIQDPQTFEVRTAADHLGRMLVGVTKTVPPSVTAEEVRLAPAAQDWDRTVFARDIARHAMLMVESSQS